MKFEVRTSDRAAKDIKKLDKITRVRVYKMIEKPEDPFSLDIKKIEGHIYRVRVGNFRTIIEIGFENQIVWVAKVGKEKEYMSACNSLS